LFARISSKTCATRSPFAASCAGSGKPGTSRRRREFAKSSPRKSTWNEELFRVLEGFPDLAHDDEVDTCSGALEMLNVPIKGAAILGYYRLRAQEFAEQRKPNANPAPGSLE